MIDQDKMRALAKAAPGGGWETWTSNSWRRVYAGGNPAITPCVHPHDNHPDLTFAPGVREWIEAATPDVIVALLDKMDAMESENNRLRAELEAAAADKRDALAFRDLMAKVIREINHGEYNHPYRGIENAPMHGHEVPGIWDSDNGAKAGTPCAWCATWNAARAALAQRQGEGS